MNVRRRVIALWVAASLALPLASAPPPAASPADGLNDPLIEQGLNALFNLNYAEARRAFETLSQRSPDNPAGAYGQATTLWWELTNEYDESNPELEQAFLAAVEETVRQTRPLVKGKRDTTGLAHLCLGGALGLKARWDAIQGHWLAAYREGKQAFNLQEKAIRINPELYDAYLGVGIFHYYTATLPAVVKVLAKLIFGGNKQQGLDEIHLAMTKGRFSRTAAQLFLVGIYNNNEREPRRALALIREGRREFPDSPFFHFVELLTLENAQDWSAEREGAEDYLKRIEEGRPGYTPRRRHMALFLRANSDLGAGRAADALGQYDRILKDYPLGDRWISWTHLNRGKALDLLGRRAEAVAAYRVVLQRRDVWELHDQAKRRISKPYTPPEQGL